MDISKKHLQFMLKHKRVLSVLCFLIILFPICFIYMEYKDIEGKSIDAEVDKISYKLEHYYQDSIDELSFIKTYATSFASFIELKNFFDTPTPANFQTFINQKWIKEVLASDLLSKLTLYDEYGEKLIMARLQENVPPLIITSITHQKEKDDQIQSLIQMSNRTVIKSEIDNDKFGLFLFHKVEDDNKVYGYFSLHIDIDALLKRIKFSHNYEFPLLVINDQGNILIDYFWNDKNINKSNYSQTLEHIDLKLWNIVAYNPWTRFYKKDHDYYVFRYFNYPLTHDEYELAVITRISEDIIQSTMNELLNPLLTQGVLLFCVALLLTYPFYYTWRTAENFILDEELKKLPMLSSTPIIITNEKHELIMINDAALKLFDTTYEQVKGKDPYKLEHLKPISQKQIKELRFGLVTQGEWSGKLGMVKENGEIIDELVNVRRVDGPDGNAHYYIGIFYDIHQHTDHLNALKNQVEKDPVTGCYNRTYFYKKIEREIAFINQHKPEYKSSMAIIHVENFAEYSRHYGHLEGDLLLAYIGEILRDFSYSTDIICRFRGEIFSIIIPFASLERVQEKVEALKLFMKQERAQYPHQGHLVSEQISLSVVFSEISADNGIDLLLKNLDQKYRTDRDVIRINLGAQA